MSNARLISKLYNRFRKPWIIEVHTRNEHMRVAHPLVLASALRAVVVHSFTAHKKPYRASVHRGLGIVTMTASGTTAASASSPPTTTTKSILYDMPVSNNGARCRLIIYKKQISDVEIQSPTVLGGLKSPEYLQCNPQGKMPLLSCPAPEEGNPGLLHLAESDTIARYLLSKYASLGPSFQPDNPRSNLMARIHDMYITTIQGALYKATPPFGPFGTRKTALAELQKQLLVLENLVVDRGLYLCGDDVSLADATIFPTLVFLSHMLPKFDIAAPALPNKLGRYYDEVALQDADFAKVRGEITGALQGWDTNQRWDGILGAGWRDDAPATLFDKIIDGQIPASIVPQPDDAVLAFKDINPMAPAHVLIIPKDRNGLTRLTNANADHQEMLGRLMVCCFSLRVVSTGSFTNTAVVVVCSHRAIMIRLRLRPLPRTSRSVLVTAPELLSTMAPMADKK
jgi:glutathione S-transferase